ELQSLNSGVVRWQSNLESIFERAATTLSTVPTRAKHPSSSMGTTLILPAAETIMHSAGGARTYRSAALATTLSSSAQAPACLTSAARRSQKAMTLFEATNTQQAMPTKPNAHRVTSSS